MSFARPEALWLLLLLPVLAVFDVRWGISLKAKLRFSDRRLLGPGRGSFASFRALSALRLAAIALGLVAWARPQEGQSREESLTPVTDILLVLDISDSMRSLDFAPKDRLGAALDVLKTFVQAREHDRLGLVLFAKYAFTQCPLTADRGALLGFLDKVKIGMVDERQTAIGSALAVAAGRLKNSEAKSKVVVLLTDGNNNAGDVDPVTAAKAAAALGVKIYAVGAGSPEGGIFPEEGIFGRRLVRRPGQELDEATLRRVAETGGGRYFRATDMDSLKKIYKEIDALEKTEVQVVTFSDYQDRYFPFLLAAFFVFAIEMLLSQTIWRRLP